MQLKEDKIKKMKIVCRRRRYRYRYRPSPYCHRHAETWSRRSRRTQYMQWRPLERIVCSECNQWRRRLYTAGQPSPGACFIVTIFFMIKLLFLISYVEVWIKTDLLKMFNKLIIISDTSSVRVITPKWSCVGNYRKSGRNAAKKTSQWINAAAPWDGPSYSKIMCFDHISN